MTTCRSQLRRHREELKDDPERLPTRFIAELAGCLCVRNPGKALRRRAHMHVGNFGRWRIPRSVQWFFLPGREVKE